MFLWDYGKAKFNNVKFIITVIVVSKNLQYDQYKGADPTFKDFQWSYCVQILASDKDFP